MPATQLATKASTPDGPLDAAKLDQEVAESDVKRLTKAIADLRKRGPGSDPALLGCLQAELEGAQKILRRIDLEAGERTAAAAGPLPPGVLQKIRLRRRRVEDLHAAVLGRMGESQRLRAHLQGLKNSIAALRQSWAFREDQREVRNRYLFPPDAETRDHPAPARGGQKNSKSMERLALMERDVETTGVELTISAAAQAEASARWEGEKAVLDAWESAVRSLGASARAMLDALPAAGAATMGAVTNTTDFRDGIVGFTTPLIR